MFRGATLVVSVTIGSLLATPTTAATPSLLWSGARGVAVHCLASSTTLANADLFERALCERVRILARARTRLPIRIVEAGDPAFIRRDTLLLLVHASVEPAPAGRLIAFVMRPYRPSGGDAEIYFGAAPRALTVKGALTGPALDAEIRKSLSEIIPGQHPAAALGRPL